jgi:ATP-dependent helicase/nuclease subunit A
MSERRFQERWREYLDSLSDDPVAAAVIDRVLGLGLFPSDLETLAKGLTARADLLSVLQSRLPVPAAPSWADLERAGMVLGAIVTARVPVEDGLLRKIEDLRALVRDMMSRPEEREPTLAGAASTFGRITFGRSGNAPNWAGAATIKAVRETGERTRDALDGLLQACRAEALRDLMPFIISFVDNDARTRGREGLMTFDDLILRVRDLLRDDREARQSLRSRYAVLLIDEFQDTDPLQVDIARAFATDPDSGAIEAGRLFLVGDPKQSIYRFRRADMAIYSRTREAVETAGGGVLPLQRNRRSRLVILDWVNRVFEQLISHEAQRSIQPEYLPIHNHRNEDVRGPGVGCFGEMIDDKTARQVRAAESRDVAGLCRMAIADRWEVFDQREKGVRAASYRDIAVLIPSRNVLSSLERSLSSAGVPYRVEGGSLIYRTQEVRDVINCLTAIDDPADEVAIVGALRSPAFACSDVDLGRFVAARGKFNYLRSALDGAEGPVADGLRVLGRYHQSRHDQSLSELVEGFVTESGQVESGILDQGDRNSFRRMRFLIEQARAFEAGGPESLRAFVQWLERRSAQVMLDNEGAGLDDDEDAVRIMTIHGAKGLEFPVVILAGMATAPRYRADTYAVDRASGEIAINVGAKTGGRRFQLGNVEGLEQIEKAHTDAEFVRVLYVAATRARDHLVFSLYHARAGSAAAQLLSAGADEGIAVLSPPETPVDSERTPFADVRVDLPEATTAEELAAQRRALVDASRTREFTSATSLGHERKDETEDDTEPWSRGRAGTRLGRAVHAAIQSLSLTPDDVTIDAFSRAQAVAEAVPEREAEVARLVRAALASEAASRARTAPRALREVPFAWQMDGTTIEGFIDMLIEAPEGIEIVDWKTDRVPPDEVPSRLDTYRLQAGLYVLGVERATQRKVHRVTYVFVSAGREASPGDPAELSAYSLAQIRAQAH